MNTKTKVPQSRIKKPKSTPPKQQPVATAFHAEMEGGDDHVVGIGNLRVMLFNDDGSWFAQGLEVDYFAQGSTLEDAQKRFQDGLWETIDYHLRIYGDITRVLQVAPAEAWKEFFGKSAMLKKRFTQLSIHTGVASHLPFEQMDFYVERAA